MELKAFHNEEDNQQYKNVDSVTGPFDVFWNFIYTGTPFALNKKVTFANFGSGLSTRLAVIPLCNEKFKMMPLRKRSKTNIQVIDELKAWAYRMDQVKGELKGFWPLVEHTWRWVAKLMDIAKEDQDDALALIIKRIPYYGINVAAPYILMRHWKEWNEKAEVTIDEQDKELCTLIMEIQLFSQKLYFGKYAESYFNERINEMNDKKSAVITKRADLTFAKLPDAFTVEDVINYGGYTKSSAYNVVCAFVNCGMARLKRQGNVRKYVKR